MSISELHAHSCYSLYDGLGTPETRAKYAAEIGLYGLVALDHGTMAGNVRHYHACKQYGVHPVLGIEAYFMPAFERSNTRYHMTLLAMSDKGYSNLCQMTSKAAMDYFYRYPIIPWELLKEHNDGIILLSGCVGGYLSRVIAEGVKREEREEPNDWREQADLWVKNYLRVFKDRFYFEVQPYDEGEGMQYIVNREILRLGDKFDVPVVLTTDAHYTKPEEYSTHQLMFKMGNKSFDADYSKRYLATETQRSLAWADLMRPALNEGLTFDITGHEYMHNADLVAKRCQVNLDFPEDIPVLEWGMPSDELLEKLVRDGMQAKGKYDGEYNRKYRDRLDTEFEVIYAKGYVDYFLLCKDIYNFADANDIKYGKGRGSVCGSLIAYAIGLTDVDPLVHGTLFERFLRPNKNELPDIDMDFPRGRRKEILAYLLERYQGRSARIGTFGLYKVKNLINDLGRVLEVPDIEIDRMKKTLLEMLNESEDESGESVPFAEMASDDLYAYLMENDDLASDDYLYSSIILHFSRLYGQTKYMGKHPAGIAVTSREVTDLIPLVRAGDVIQTAYNLQDLARIGAVKVDILGLAFLDMLHDIEKMIDKQYDVYELLDDYETLEAFRLAHTTGVFQFESKGARKLLRQVQPTKFEHLVACNALNRPGPIKAGVLDEYVMRKHAHEAHKPFPGDDGTFAADTYGVIVYQEQVMELARAVGLDWADADLLMKGVAKKNNEALAQIRPRFVAGCVASAMSQELAEELFRSSTLYAFNKSHAVAYTLMGFYAMYLKLHHPAEFFTAILRHEEREVKRLEYELEAALLDIGVRIPNINSDITYRLITDPDGDRWIERGLMTINGLGVVSASSIAQRGPYSTIGDFNAKRDKRAVNDGTMKALDREGALVLDEDRIWELSIEYDRKLPRLLENARKEAYVGKKKLAMYRRTEQ